MSIPGSDVNDPTHRSARPGRAPAALLLALAGLLPFAGPARGASQADLFVAQAAADMQRARETGDPTWYTAAAAALDGAVAVEPDHYGALRARAWVLLGQHRFAAARAAVDAALARAPDDWWNHANLADACLELGDVACAERAVERLMALRPGVAAYTRVAALRTLYGDRDGAIEALELAAASAPGNPPEATAWVLVYLGHEHFAGGARAGARAAYERALALVPDYHLALAGLARVAAADGRIPEAIALAERVADRVPQPSLLAFLGDLHALAGDDRGAARRLDQALAMERLAAAAGGSYGRETALVLADHDRDLPDALRLARAESAARDDVATSDALAWALHKNGRHAEAMRAAHRALRFGTAEASFAYHAGMIAAALGRHRRAERHLHKALAWNPYFDVRQAAVAHAALARLDGRRVARSEHGDRR